VTPIESILVVLPPTPGAERGVASLRVAGLTLLRRLVLAALSAGYTRVVVADSANDRAALAGASAGGLASAPVPSSAYHRLIVVPSNVVPQKRWLRALYEAPIERDTLYADAALGVGVVETQRLDVVMAAARGDGATDVLERLRKVFESHPLTPDPIGCQREPKTPHLR
jgi:hypothetical protein